MMGIWDILLEMESLFGFRATHFVGMWIAVSLIGSFTSNMILFGGISLGQLASRAKLFLGIVFYILIVVAEQMIVSLFRSFADSFGIYMNLKMDLQFIVDLLAAALLYAATYMIISKKLNLV